MQSNIYLIIILIIIATQFLISLLVSVLDYNYKKVPQGGQTIKKDYVKSKNYLRSSIKFGLTKAVVDISILLVVIFTGILNNLDLIIRSLGNGVILNGLLFFGTIGIITFLIGLPFSIYNTFKIEKKYGFNKTTKKTFVLDEIKSLAGYTLIGAIGIAIILFFFQKAGSLAWLYCWIFLTIMQIFTMFIYPVFILPLFNNLKILKDSPLKEAIRRYLEDNNINIKMSNIRIIDASKRTNKSTAFLAGFGINKRLVLSDTLLKNHTQEEILAVVGHEVGHLKMKHLPKKLILYTVETFLMMFLLSIIIQNSNFFLAFGVENISVYLGLMLFSIVYSPISFIFSTLTNYLSRKYEYAADIYSARTTSPEAMSSALDKLGANNLTNPTPHPLNVAFNYTHPPIKDRITTLENLIKIRDITTMKQREAKDNE